MLAVTKTWKSSIRCYFGLFLHKPKLPVLVKHQEAEKNANLVFSWYLQHGLQGSSGSIKAPLGAISITIGITLRPNLSG